MELKKNVNSLLGIVILALLLNGCQLKTNRRPNLNFSSDSIVAKSVEIIEGNDFEGAQAEEQERVYWRDDVLAFELCNSRDLIDEVIGIDDTRDLTSREIFKSHIFDGIFGIKKGEYIQYFYGGSHQSDFYISVYSREELSMKRIFAVVSLKYGDQECEVLTDTLTYRRPFLVSFAKEKPAYDDFINYFAIGVYKNPDGRVFDPKSDDISEAEVYNNYWRFVVSRVYGVEKDGRITILPEYVGIGYSSLLEGKSGFFNDTIVFLSPEQ